MIIVRQLLPKISQLLQPRLTSFLAKPERWGNFCGVLTIPSATFLEGDFAEGGTVAVKR